MLKESSFSLAFFCSIEVSLGIKISSEMKNKIAEIRPNSKFGAKPKLYILSLLHLKFSWHQKKFEWNKKKKIKL